MLCSNIWLDRTAQQLGYPSRYALRRPVSPKRRGVLITREEEKS